MLHGSRNEALVMSGSGPAARTSTGVHLCPVFPAGSGAGLPGGPRPAPLLRHARMPACSAEHVVGADCCGALTANRLLLPADGAAPNGTSH